MMLPLAKHLLHRQIAKAEAELQWVLRVSDEEAMKLSDHIDQMRIELMKLRTLEKMFKTDRDEELINSKNHN